MWYLAVLGFVCSYLLGNLNGAVIVSSVYAHDDVRTHGSGNAGLTNFIRTYGPQIAIYVILIDVGKGILGLVGRGFTTVVKPEFRDSAKLTKCATCLECANACPTGALKILK